MHVAMWTMGDGVGYRNFVRIMRVRDTGVPIYSWPRGNRNKNKGKNDAKMHFSTCYVCYRVDRVKCVLEDWV